MVRKYLSTRERIILYLSQYRDNFSHYNAPFDITQEGIAKGIGIGRNNLPRELTTLLADNIIISKKVRVRGLKNRRNVYVLTPAGIQRAKELIDRISELQVRVITSSGEEKILIRDISKKFGISIVQAANNLTKDMTLDLLSLFRNKTKKVHFIEEDYIIKSFYGREKELEGLKEWYAGSKSILLLTGLSGFGKTTLMLKFVREQLKNEDVFFININESDDPISVLNKLSAFLSSVGYPKLEKYLRTRGKRIEDGLEWNNVFSLIRESLRYGVYIFDNVESINPMLGKFFRHFLKVLDYSNKFKIVLIGNTSSDVVPLDIMANAKEMHIEELSEEAAYRMLIDMGVDDAQAYKILSKYGGNPMLLVLAKSHTPQMLRKFIFDGILGDLSEKETKAVKFLSVFRRPVRISALLLNNIDYSVIYSLINKNIFVEFEFEVITLHKMIRNFMYERLTKMEKSEYHKAAAEYLVEEGDVLEAIYHFVNGEMLLRAVVLLSDYYERYIFERPGVVRSIAMDILNNYSDEIDAREGLLYFIVGETYYHSGEWSKATEYYKKAETLAGNDPDTWAKSKLRLGELLTKIGDYQAAKSALDMVYASRDKIIDRKLLPELYYVLGMSCFFMGEYDSAEEHLTEALKFSQQYADYRVMGYSSIGLGILHRKQGDYNMAIELFNRAKEYFEVVNHKVGITKALINLGITYYDMYDSTAESYLLSAKNMLKSVSDKYISAFVAKTLGIMYVSQEQWKLGEQNLKDAERLFKELNVKEPLAGVYAGLGAIYSHYSKPIDAMNYFDMAIDIAYQNGAYSQARTTAEYAVSSLKKYKSINLDKYEEILKNKDAFVSVVEK